MIKYSYIFFLIITNIIIGKELPIIEIKLSGLITNPKQEISGMDWFQKRLFLLPENQGGYLFSFDKFELMKAINSQNKNNKPLTPKQTRFETPDYKSLIPGFEGFEAISFYNNNIYISLEAENNGIMQCYIVWGKIDSKTYEVSIPEENLIQINTPIQLTNMTYETIVNTNDNLYIIYEANGANLQKTVSQKVLSFNNNDISEISFPNIEYRITDATKVDSENKFWCINYFWPGDKKLLNPSSDNVFKKTKKGNSHQNSEIVERLIEFEIKNNQIVLSDKDPIQVVLDDKDSRNWEAIARLDNKGFLIATDKYPRMILGFIPVKN